MKLPSKKAWSVRGRRGFALIVTLSLMILLTVIAVGLLTLSTISLRRSSSESAMEVARANARLAMMMALGELQLQLGPDSRISARAETMAKSDRVGSSLTAAGPQAWWVGVTDYDKTKTLRGPHTDSVVWLVSGLKGTNAAANLTEGIKDPVTLVGAGSLDLTLTGGQPLQGGRVEIRNSSNKPTGAYAWYVDDNGMKAQLAASNKEVRNDNVAANTGAKYGGNIIPGSYPVGILEQMAPLNGTSVDNLQKLVSTHNLTLAKLPEEVMKNKYFSYTTFSRGVLSDVRQNCLKKDLTIAFENPVTFNSAFPTSNLDKYIVMDRSRRAGRTDIDNVKGYINWNTFRDYYNLKKSIITVNGSQALMPTAIDKAGFVESANFAFDAFRSGTFGPHDMWKATAASSVSSNANLPYGAMQPSATGFATSQINPSNYASNPISTVLQSLQETAWVSQEGGKIKTNVQLFAADYNPYNISLALLAAPNKDAGARLHNFPQVFFTVSGTTITKKEGLDPKFQVHTKPAVVIEPGRSNILAFASSGKLGDEKDGGLFSESVKDVFDKSVFKEYDGTLPTSGDIGLTFEFALMYPALAHGLDENPGDKELTQIFYTPFSWDSITTPAGTRAGKKISKTAKGGQVGPNLKVAMGMRLRTTREPGQDALRPLIDSNIRAMWNNVRWDSPLGLSQLAGYSSENKGEIINQPTPQMEVSAQPKGFAYWGDSRSSSNGNDRVVLFDVPRKDLVSIGQLQHANAGRFSYEPTYIVGNSYANPRIPLGDWKASVSDTFSGPRGLPAIGVPFNLYDASYLVNEVMFDSYTFTTIPQAADDYPGPGGTGMAPTAANFTNLLKGSQQLPNPRYLPYVPPGSNFNAGTLAVAGNPTSGPYFHNAGHVMVDGAFNVNSTSVDAWEAFLSGTYQLPVQKVGTNGLISGFHTTGNVRFPRAASHVSDGMKTSSIDSSYWTGFRELEQKEVRQIATRLVEEIKQRGPFLSLGEFVNRKLTNTGELGKSGALQAALDATVNKGLNSSYESPVAVASGIGSKIPNDNTQGAGFPGQLLQGDVLQALAPFMTVRSDSFTIRAYGEARDAANNVTARTWCEATVQRYPDPMPTPSSVSTTTALMQIAKPDSPFGRRFRVLSFRWLHPEEV